MSRQHDIASLAIATMTLPLASAPGPEELEPYVRTTQPRIVQLPAFSERRDGHVSSCKEVDDAVSPFFAILRPRLV